MDTSKLAPRGDRTLTNLLLAIGALALGMVAQGYGEIKLAHSLVTSPAPTPTDELLVYAVVAVLFGFAAARTPAWPELPPPGPANLAIDDRPHAPLAKRTTPRALPFARGKTVRPTFALTLLALAGVAIVISLRLFGQEEMDTLEWAFYLAAIALFVVAASTLETRSVILSERFSNRGAMKHRQNLLFFLKNRVSGLGQAARPVDKLKVTRREWIALLLTLLVAAFFRLYRFKEFPYGLWYDEADNGLWARQILADPNFRPIYVSSTNLPAHLLYLIALAFRLLGDSMYAIRSVAVAFGMLTVLAAYFCGREIFGWERSGRYMGIVLAFLLAVSRWDVNWSRIGMHGVTVPFFELWVVAALLRGLRTGCLRAFAWAGVALGLGLCFYTPMRVFPLIVGGFLLARLGTNPFSSLRLSLRLQRKRVCRVRAGQALATWGMPFLFLIAGALIAVGPVAQFALRHPDVFWDRTKRISLFKEADAQAYPLQAISRNTARHLLMFNYRGDPNGRHNLPGRPMLDRLGGVLFVLGLVVCVLHWYVPRSVLLLLWLLIPLGGGVLSVSFESPQSLRSIGALPAAYLLICLPVEWFAAEWQRVFGPAAQRRLTGPAVLLLLAIGLSEGTTTFYYRARDFASWAAFNAAETRLAQEINRWGDDYELRFDPLLTAHLTTRYLAPDYTAYHHFDPATVFPLQGTDKAGVLLFIAPDTYIVREHAHWLYPGVRVETFAHPYSQNVVLYKYLFDRDLIASVQGLDARYQSLPVTESAVHADQSIRQQVDGGVDFDWGDAPPQAYPLEAIWSGGLLAPEYGTYTLHVDAPGQVSLSLDGQTVLSGPGPQSRQITMAQGVHALHLSCQVPVSGPLRLLWSTPWDPALRPVPRDALYRSSWPVNGLVGRFYANADWSGEPAIVRLDRQIATYFHFLPLPRPYTAEWSGRLAAPAEGVYHLGVRAVSTASLYVDGQLAIEHSAPGEYQEVERTLTAGLHDIRLRFLDDQDRSQVYLYWMLPNTKDASLIPPGSLFLPQEGAWQGAPQ